MLPLATEMAPEKITVQCRARVIASCFAQELEVCGYEIHQGRTTLEGDAEAFLQVTQADGRQYVDGFIADNGRVWGSYMHGIFDDDSFRAAYLAWLREHIANVSQSSNHAVAGISYKQRKEDGLNALADLLLKSLDMKMIDQLAGL